ncbi:MAG: hypothetical protein IKW38_00135 [Kiritimatiellae bacterium]|nr:hypothetical protein [Kiritimatiellia bacterium]
MAITFTETKKKSLEERLAERQRQAIDRANALKESAYNNRLAGIGLEDNPSAAKVHGQRELIAKTGPNGRTYLYDKEGNITVGTDFQRAMAPDEYRKLETEEGRSEVYAPENRVRGVSYVGSQQLDPRELAMKARERALDRAGMTDMKSINKALQMRRNIRSAMEAESGPSAAQMDAAKQWNLERTFGGTHGAKARVAQMGIEDARRQAERDQALTLAILGHDKDRDVAKLQNEGNLAVETQRGTNAVDLAKQQGADNLAVAKQQGADNLAVAKQQGADNLAVTQAQGTNAVDLAKQQGADNLAVTQAQGTNAVDLAKQQGADNLAVAKQQGADNLAVTQAQGTNAVDLAKQQGADNLAVTQAQGTNALNVAKQQGADNVKIAEMQSADAAKVKAAEHVKDIEKRSNDILTLAAKFANRGSLSPEEMALLISTTNTLRVPNDLKQAFLQNPNNTNLAPVFEALIGDVNRYRTEIGLPPIQLNSQQANNPPGPIINI